MYMPRFYKRNRGIFIGKIILIDILVIYVIR